MKFLPPRPWLQFRLWMLLAAFVPTGYGALWLKDYLDARPIPVIAYSDAELQRQLDRGHPVLIDINALLC